MFAVIMQPELYKSLTTRPKKTQGITYFNISFKTLNNLFGTLEELMLILDMRVSLFDITLSWEEAAPLPRCHNVFLISCLYHLNVLPYIPLANTGCLWVCNPKNTKVHISTMYTHARTHAYTHTRIHKLKEQITARFNAALAAILHSQHALLPGSAVERVMGSPWYINNPVYKAHRDITLT